MSLIGSFCKYLVDNYIIILTLLLFILLGLSLGKVPKYFLLWAHHTGTDSQQGFPYSLRIGSQQASSIQFDVAPSYIVKLDEALRNTV